MRDLIESILEDQQVLRELKERESELLGKAARGEANAGSFVESLARTSAAEARSAPGMEESLRRLESRTSDLADVSMTEAIIVRFGHPSLLVRNGTFEEPDLETWKDRLDPFRDTIDKAIGAVGRVELKGHQLKWVGTGWLIDEQTIVTNRHVAREFTDKWDNYRTIKSGMSASLDFYEEYESVLELVVAIEGVVHVEDGNGADMALLRVDRKALAKLDFEPIAIADRIRDGVTIGVIGYPAYDSRNDPADMSRIFEDIYNKKRFAPGKVVEKPAPDWAFAHDCTTLGGNSGSAVIDVESGCAIGLHYGGREGDRNVAVNAATIRDIAARNRVSVRGYSPGAGGGRGGGTGAATESPESLAGREGYTPLFLGDGDMAAVPLPALNQLQTRQAAKLADGTLELKYMHFSLVMNAARRLAFFTAVNIDGTDLWHKPRRSDPWQTDPRIPDDAQVDNALYRHNDFDRGHLVRRLDPVWGPKPDAKIAEADTFYYTNAAPQHKDLNRRIWLDLENHVLENTDEKDARITVFAGPILGSADPRSKRSGLEEIGIPLGYWKVIVSIGRTRRGRRELQAQAFVMWQWDMFGDSDLELVFGRRFETYQLAVTDLERLTGLDFSARVRDADTFEKAPEGEEATESFFGGRAGPRLQLETIRSPDDII